MKSLSPSFMVRKKRWENLEFWVALFEEYRQECVCLDIETEGIGKPITVVGVYRHVLGEQKLIQLVQGANLSAQHIRKACKGAKLLITFNGIKHDIPRINAEFPGSLPHIPVLDIYLISRRFGMGFSLKVLERKFSIARTGEEQAEHVAVRFWSKFKRENDAKALQALLDYNRQDTVNLMRLADLLSVSIMAGRRAKKRNRRSRRHHAFRAR